MAQNYARSPDFKTPPCRLSFAQTLFEPKAQEGSSVEKYGCTLIFKKDVDRSSLDNAVIQVIRDTWGEKGMARVKQGLIKTPFLDGMSKQAHSQKTGELHAGMGEDVFFIRPQATLKNPPVVLYRSPTVPATQAEVYSGCYGFAILNAYAWNHPTSGDGVSFGIRMFQKKADGERIGGGGPVDTEKWHETIADEGPAEIKSGRGAAELFG